MRSRFSVMCVALMSALVALAGATACSDAIEEPTYEYGLFPHVAHSGFNPKATYRVMFATGAPEPRWSVDDPDLATIQPSMPPAIEGTDVKSLSFALVTTKKEGVSTVRMTSGATTLTAQLMVKAYTDEQLAAGKARYETASSDPSRPPCASCHAKPGGVDHSPLKMAGFDDATILGVIQNATYPPSPTGQSTTSAFAPAGPLSFKGHTWNLTDPEKDGILAHLRSLPLGGL